MSNWVSSLSLLPCCKLQEYLQMESSSDEEFVLLDSLFPKLIRPRRRYGVHTINKERASLGEYHHLFRQLKCYPDRFYAYMRMTVETFGYILNKIEHRLMKIWCNWHRPILPEERLVVTMRSVIQTLNSQTT